MNRSLSILETPLNKARLWLVGKLATTDERLLLTHCLHIAEKEFYYKGSRSSYAVGFGYYKDVEAIQDLKKVFEEEIDWEI